MTADRFTVQQMTIRKQESTPGPVVEVELLLADLSVPAMAASEAEDC